MWEKGEKTEREKERTVNLRSRKMGKTAVGLNFPDFPCKVCVCDSYLDAFPTVSRASSGSPQHNRPDASHCTFLTLLTCLPPNSSSFSAFSAGRGQAHKQTCKFSDRGHQIACVLPPPTPQTAPCADSPQLLWGTGAI